MKLPTKLKIGGHDIAVKELTNLESPDAGGSWQDGYHLITINVDSTSESYQAETLLHEIIECINSFAELDLEHWKINSLSQWLYMTLRKNKLHFDDKEERVLYEKD